MRAAFVVTDLAAAVMGAAVRAAPELKMDLPDWRKTPVIDHDLGTASTCSRASAATSRCWVASTDLLRERVRNNLGLRDLRSIAQAHPV